MGVWVLSGEAKQRFLDLLRERFNSGVRYKGRAFKWDTVIEQKIAELSRCLVGRCPRLNRPHPWRMLHISSYQHQQQRIPSLTIHLPSVWWSAGELQSSIRAHTAHLDSSSRQSLIHESRPPRSERCRGQQAHRRKNARHSYMST